ncbi:MAG: YitT family protein [Clostridia bacterium]|nr:YitT family protein [Clostridia bacterium]
MQAVRWKLEIKNAVLIAVASLIAAIGLWVFVTPGQFAPSGVDGIAAMLQELMRGAGMDIRAGYFSTLLNIPLLVAAWFVLKKRYVLYTLAYMLLLFAYTTVFGWIDLPVYPVTSETTRLLAAVMGGIAQGLTGLMLRVGGSAGGVDVIACMIQKKRQSDNVERIIAILSYIISAFSFFVWKGDVNAVIYSFIAIYICERTTAALLRDSRKAVKFEIIVCKEQADCIKDMIVYEMKRSATVINAKGIFLGEEKELILCLVHYRQFSEFLMKISEYPCVFLTYSEVLGIRGNFDWVLEYERPEDVTMREQRLQKRDMLFEEQQKE